MIDNLSMVVQVLVGLFVPTVFLSLIQILLSSIKKTKIPGLILPVMNITVGVYVGIVVMILSAANMQGMSPNYVKVVVSTVLFLLVWNIPTLVYIIIYKICRKRVAETLEIMKMNVQDL